MKWVVLPGVFVLFSVGCSPTYAPPIRSAHMGAPEDVEAGTIEIAASSSGIEGPIGILDTSLSYAVSDRVSIEGGHNHAFFDNNSWSLGFGGLRIRGTLDVGPRYLSLSGDIETGFGIGAGGKYRGGEEPDLDNRDRMWSERLALGGYLGVGGSINLTWVSFFGRTRVQFAGAEGVPVTLWYSLTGGIQFNLGSWFRVYGAAGMALFDNREDDEIGFVSEFGLRFRIPSRANDPMVATYH